MLSAFSVAAFIATMRAICSLTAASRKHLNNRTLKLVGTTSSRMLSAEGRNSYCDSAAGSFATLRQTATFLGRFGNWDVAGAFTGLKTNGHRDGAGGERADTLDERYAQHLGNCPEFADRQRAHGLVGLNKRQDILPVQAQFRMGNEIFGQTVDARQPPVGIGGERGELPVKAPGKVQ